MISEPELLSIAGATSYAKGRSIFQQGHVQLQAQSENEVRGLVSGTYDYAVSFCHDNGNFSFSCNCPAFDYQEVCKHCVALVLAAVSPLDQNKPGNTPPTRPDNKDDILKRYIGTLPADKLCQSLYELICADKYQYNRWVTKAELASSHQDLKSLKKLVNKALPLKDIWEYRKVTVYFDNAQQIIADLLETAQALAATEQLKLILQVYERLEKVCERVDDSGGYRFDLQYLLATELPGVIAKQPWSAEQKARWLIEALEFEYESFPAIPGDFQLEQSEMQVFLTLCQAQFDEVEVNMDLASRQRNHLLNQRGQILLSYLPEAENFATALKIKVKMANDIRDALSISQFCLKHHDELMAEDWLLRAKSLVSVSHQQASWDSQAIKVYAALGETKRAWHIAWQRFENRPGYLAWQCLQKDIETIGWQPEKLKMDVERHLLEAGKPGKSNRPGFSNADIVYFYLSEKEFSKAVAWLDDNKAGEPVLAEASVQLAAEFPEKAILYCARALSLILQQANSKNYQEAISLLKRLDDKLPDDEAVKAKFERLIALIAAENSRRPNMMILLRGEFGQYLD